MTQQMESSVELRDFMLQLYQTMSNDAAGFARYVSQQPGVVAIGTAPEEWWSDHATISRIFKTQFEELGSFSVVEANPQAYRAGNVGWVADRATLRLADRTEVPFRLTVVLLQEQGEWQIAQWHASIGISNQEAIGQELTV